MTSHQLILPGTNVKKHNELVRNKVNITSVHGSRILAQLLTCIRYDDTKFKETYQIRVKDLLPDLGGGNYNQIKEVCKELIRSAVEIEMPAPDNETCLVLFSFFSSIKYEKGIIEARFNQDMKNFLLELKKHYTQYNIFEYSLLSSVYSQRLYELLKSWSSLPEIVIELKELHKILLVPESAKKNFGEFKRNILEKSKKEIFKKTNLHFEYETKKLSRAVVAVHFIFAKNRALPVAQEKKIKLQQKKSKTNTKKFTTAIGCATTKNGICMKQDNKKNICALCIQFNMCDELIKKANTAACVLPLMPIEI